MYIGALGAGANVLDRKIGASCSIPCRGCDIADLSILMPIMKGPPGGPGCHYKEPNAIVQGSRAAVFLLPVDLQYLSCARNGTEG